jgi:uncharacterized protein
MNKKVTISIAPEHIHDDSFIKTIALQEAGISMDAPINVFVVKKSIDARGRQIKYILQCEIVAATQEFSLLKSIEYKEVSNAKESVVIIGAGPAGLFCALRLIELGIRPIVIDRGKQVRERRRDLAALNKEGILNEESNYCFGEGGAGTYSDGKLYTRSGKRGSIEKILQCFVQFGASENILIEAHPHIGTNKLPNIIAAMREKIIECGGQVHFNTKLLDIQIQNNEVQKIVTNQFVLDTKKIVLATGHSAHDVYELLQQKNIFLEAKPLAIGVRVEHPQSFVDECQYHRIDRGDILPPAAYSLVQQINGRGVFSFCMCPGGIIATASTQKEKLVINGWSPSKRNNPYANSGMVVAIDPAEMKAFAKRGALAAMYYQQSIEEKAFVAGGGKYQAPAMRMTDFVKNKASASLPSSSYLPGLQAAHLSEVLPPVIMSSLQLGFMEFNKKMKGFVQQDAVVVATESRTSSPVRIPRDKDSLQHNQVKGLYPCGEGAGYAGGIVSAAMDGERIADAIANAK